MWRDLMSRRLARRFLRHAGVFEAPPAMLAQIGTWMHSVYAGHVLAQTLAQLDHLRDATGQLQSALDEMAKAERSIPRELDTLRRGGSVRVVVHSAVADLLRGLKTSRRAGSVVATLAGWRLQLDQEIERRQVAR